MMTLTTDEGSGLTQVVNHGERHGNRSAADFEAVLSQWCKWYVKPDLIRMDAEGCHRAGSIREWCSVRDIGNWIAPGQAHWLLGKVERKVGVFTQMLTRMWETLFYAPQQ